MGREHGKFKADRISGSIIARIDREGAAEVCERDREGAGVLAAYRGRLFDERYTLRGENKRVYTPTKKED